MLLAAEGLTDKEIASRLGLSAETVGTYWRRILAKHNAASRTEVVAKVIELRAQGEKDKLEDLAQSFREVTDHLFMQVEQLQTVPTFNDSVSWQSVVDCISDVMLVIDIEAFVCLRSKATPELTLATGEPIEWSVHPDDREVLRVAISEALDAMRPASISVRFAYADGSYLRHRAKVTPIPDRPELAIQVIVE